MKAIISLKSKQLVLEPETEFEKEISAKIDCIKRQKGIGDNINKNIYQLWIHFSGVAGR